MWSAVLVLKGQYHENLICSLLCVCAGNCQNFCPYVWNSNVMFYCFCRNHLFVNLCVFSHPAIEQDFHPAIEQESLTLVTVEHFRQWRWAPYSDIVTVEKVRQWKRHTPPPPREENKRSKQNLSMTHIIIIAKSAQEATYRSQFRR